MKNQIIVFPEKQTAELQEREIKKPGPGELLIKNSRTLISIGTEMTAFSGDYPAGSVWEKFFPYPFDAGYAAVGTVIEKGAGMDKSWIGKKVASEAPHCQYAVISADKLRIIHRTELPDEEAVFYIIAQIVMRGIRMSKITWAESAVIFGAGLLGHFAACFCRLLGARPVIVSDTANFRLSLLPADKSLIKVNPQKENVREKTAALTCGRMADIVFEVTGNAGLIPDEFAVLHDQGRFVIMSSPREKTSFDFHDLCNRPSHTIIGAHNQSHPLSATWENPWTAKRHCEHFFNLACDGELDIKRMISHRIAWQKAPDVYYSLMENRSEYMGIVINWENN